MFIDKKETSGYDPEGVELASNCYLSSIKSLRDYIAFKYQYLQKKEIWFLNLLQVSLLPTKKPPLSQWFFVENIGVEPMTFWLPAKRSSQLS